MIGLDAIASRTFEETIASNGTLVLIVAWCKWAPLSSDNVGVDGFSTEPCEPTAVLNGQVWPSLERM